MGKLLRLVPLLCLACLTACSSVPPVEITAPGWPPAPADEVDVHASLKQLVRDNDALKVVLRVPSVTVNVTQSQNSSNLNGAYDEIEKQLFKAGFIVRDRALLSSLIDKEGITSYQEIRKRVDTDLIIDVSSLAFNDPQNMLLSRNYPGPDGQPATFSSGFPFSMGEAVATVEAKFIIVDSGEVAGIVTLHVPICEHVACAYVDVDDPDNGYSLTSQPQPGVATNFDQTSNIVSYLWANGTGPASMGQAADLLGQKIVAVLKQ